MPHDAVLITIQGTPAREIVVNDKRDHRILRDAIRYNFCSGDSDTTCDTHDIPSRAVRHFPSSLRDLIAEEPNGWYLEFTGSEKVRTLQGRLRNQASTLDEIALASNLAFTARLERRYTDAEVHMRAITDAAWAGSVSRLAGALDGRSLGDAAKQRIGSDGKTLLHIAASRHRVAMVEALLANGAAVDARTSAGLTPLMCAVMKQPPHGWRGEDAQRLTVIALLKAGADAFCRSYSARWRCSNRGKESALTLSLCRVAARRDDLTLTLILVASWQPHQPPPAFWSVVVGRAALRLSALTEWKLIGIGLPLLSTYKRSTAAPSFFPQLIALTGADEFFSACMRHFAVSSNWRHIQLPPDCDHVSSTFGDADRGVVESPVMKWTGPMRGTQKLNAASTHLGTVDTLWNDITPVCVMLAMQRPGCYTDVSV